MCPLLFAAMQACQPTMPSLGPAGRHQRKGAGGGHGAQTLQLLAYLPRKVSRASKKQLTAQDSGHGLTVWAAPVSFWEALGRHPSPPMRLHREGKDLPFPDVLMIMSVSPRSIWDMS